MTDYDYYSNRLDKIVEDVTRVCAALAVPKDPLYPFCRWYYYGENRDVAIIEVRIGGIGMDTTIAIHRHNEGVLSSDVARAILTDFIREVLEKTRQGGV